MSFPESQGIKPGKLTTSRTDKTLTNEEFGAQNGSGASIAAPVLDCLNSIDSGGPDPLDGYFGHGKLYAAEIWPYNSDSTDTILRVTELPRRDLVGWIDQKLPTTDDESSPSGGLKMLIGLHRHRTDPELAEKDRKMMKDALRKLTKAFHITTIPFLRDLHNFPRFWSLPGSPETMSPLSRRYYLRVTAFSASWYVDHETKTTFAICFFYRHAWERGLKRLEIFLAKAEQLVNQPDFMPFVLVCTAMSLNSETLEDLAHRSHNIDDWIHELVTTQRSREHSNYSQETGRLTTDSRVVSSCQKTLRTLLDLTKIFLDKRETSGEIAKSKRKPASGYGEEEEKNKVMTEGIFCLQQAITALLVEADGRQERISKHLNTITSLTAQRDQYISIEISKASRELAEATRKDQAIIIEIAEASKTIAWESKKDSSSMKTIAAITMAFLPGTFVASFFAMPFFAWPPPAGRAVNSHIWIFWVITLPLTLIVFLLWYAWFVWKSKREVEAKAKDDLSSSRKAAVELTTLESSSTDLDGFARRSHRGLQV